MAWCQQLDAGTLPEGIFILSLVRMTVSNDTSLDGMEEELTEMEL